MSINEKVTINTTDAVTQINNLAKSLIELNKANKAIAQSEDEIKAAADAAGVSFEELNAAYNQQIGVLRKLHAAEEARKLKEQIKFPGELAKAEAKLAAQRKKQLAEDEAQLKKLAADRERRGLQALKADEALAAKRKALAERDRKVNTPDTRIVTPGISSKTDFAGLIAAEQAATAKSVQLRLKAAAEKKKIADKEAKDQEKATQKLLSDLNKGYAKWVRDEQANSRRIISIRRKQATEDKAIQDAINQARNARSSSVGTLDVAAGQLLASALQQLRSQMQQSLDVALKYNVAIAEIQSISQGAAQTTGDWSSALRGLSDSYGLDILDATQAAYNAISNQIATNGDATQQASDSLNFMREAAILATTTQGSLTNAVDASSSVIKAFGFDINQANRVNAVLFKTVENGRVVLNEMANSLGRVSSLAKLAGVSFEEQQAAIATLTVQGVKTDVTLTLLSNVFSKLIKPTEEMTKRFREWGVESGQAAIAAFGLDGVITRLGAAALEGASDLGDVADAFRDIRAVTGGAILGQNAQEFKDNLKSFQTAQQDYAKASQIIFENNSKQLQIELNKVKNIFTVDLGNSLINLIVQLNGGTAGISEAAGSLLRVVITLGSAFVLYKATLITVNTVQAAYSVAQALMATRTATTTQAFIGNKTAAVALAGAYSTLANVGIGLVITGLVAVIQHVLTVNDRINEAGDSIKNRFEAGFRQASSFIIADIDRIAIALEQDLMSQFRQLNGIFAAVRAEGNKLSDSLDADFKAIKRSVDLNLETAFRQIKKSIQDADSAATDAEKRADAANKRFRAAEEAVRDGKLGAALEGKSPLEQAKILQTEALKAEQEGIDLLKGAQEDAADEAFARSEELRKRSLDILKKGQEDELNEIEKHKNKVAAINQKEHDREEKLQKIPQRTTGNRRQQAQQFERERATDALANERSDRNAAKETAELEAAKKRVAAIDLLIADTIKKNAEAEERRLKTTKEDLDLKEKARNIAQDELRRQEESFDKLQTLFKDLDSTTDPAKFAELNKQIQALLPKVGFDKETRFNLMRDLQKQETTLFQQEEVKRTATALEEIKKRADAARADLDAARKDAVAAKEGLLPASEALIGQSLGDLTKLQEALKRVRLDINPDNITPDETVALKSLGGVVDGVEELKRLAAESKADPTNLAALEAYKTKLSEILVLVKTLSVNPEARKLFGTGAAGPTFGPGGINATQPSATDQGLTSDAIIKRTQGLLKNVNDLITKQESANKTIADQTALLKTLEEQVDRLKLAYPGLGVAAEAAMGGANNSVQETQRSVEALINSIIEAKQQLDAIRFVPGLNSSVDGPAPASPGDLGGTLFSSRGGYVDYLAHGGIAGRHPGGPRGTDTIPAWLTRGEYVWDAETTKRFLPIIKGIHQHGHYFQSGGAVSNTVNVGDITIQGGQTNSDTAKTLVAEIERLARRGTISFKR